MEKTMEALRHTQAKCSELEKGNKKLTEQTHADRREIIKLKEELHSSRAKVQWLSSVLEYHYWKFMVCAFYLVHRRAYGAYKP